MADFTAALRDSTIPFLVEARDWARLPERFQREIERGYVVVVERGDGNTAGKWQEAALGELVEIYDGPHATPKKTDAGPIFLGISNLASGRLDLDKTEHLSEEDYMRWTHRVTPRPDDVVFSYETRLGEAALIPTDLRCCLGRRMGLLRPKGGRVDARFLLYAFLGTRFQETLRSRTIHGSTVDRIPLTEMGSFPIEVPRDIDEQRAIAHILGTLDDKIELNRRMNETLEEMARALFKSWFIDFDPVHAKATLKYHAANHAPRQGDSAKAQATEAARSEITPPLRGSRQAKGVSPQASRWGDIKRLYSPQTLQKAQALRQNQTDAEGLLWHYLRNKQLDGYKFRRQQPIGPYIVDFACLSRKVLIELDGGQHVEQKAYDKQRDEFLREQGYRLLRFWNNEVFENCFGVLESIYTALRHHPALEGGSKDASHSGRGFPLPQQPAPSGLAAATPPQGGSDRTGRTDWTVERARAYLDNLGQDIADLFPDRLVDSELGEIPEGWEIREIGQIADVIDCLHSKKPERRAQGQPLLQLWNIRDDGLLDMADTYFIDDADYEQWVSRMEAVAGDCAITNVGRVGAVAQVPVGLNAALGRNMTGLRCKKSSVFPTFLIECLLSQAMRNEISLKMDTGTILEALNVRNIPKLRFVTGTKRVLSSFEQRVRPLRARMEQNLSESRTLAALRDTLLPKLVSGELRVK